ncbi:hypothetical protein BDW66DRAFT_132446 [Aspergillus desertorum]
MDSSTPLPLGILLLHTLLVKPVCLLLAQPLSLRVRSRREATPRETGGRCVTGVVAAARGGTRSAGLLGELRGVGVDFSLQLICGLFCEEGNRHIGGLLASCLLETI